ncbi:hypothetical protein TGAM01_v209449 [Trichoderma gamsii]|uniref:NIPA-like protein 2 n=1 Tax=Trichoderma gamsii TaxID=398673 RepID=A0A2P4ZBU1_9HYPO|nr:hypothetical protein TGAM01_v209449 [Trichoderma gamsii]PON21711.1 hypothetical protein TGAM01_v209449 [Trichoderma gamsii]
MSLTFTGSTLPTWTSALAAPTATGGSGDGSGGDDDGDALQRWSSLIGIITAIVGNVLIALALNVQRYAHTRLHKERKRRKQGARAALKRAQSSNSSNGSTQVGVYGTIIGDGTGNGDGNGYQNGEGNGFSIPNYDEPEDEHEYLENEPLMGSFQSTATTASTDTDTEPKTSSSNYLKSPYWWLGQILITLGEAGNFLAYGFAPASIVSPLGVVALVSNCIIAPAMFHEKFRLRDFWGVVIAVSGVVTVVLSANQKETKLNPHDVWGAITTMEFEIYFGVTTFLIIVLMWASAKYGKRTILIDLGLVGLFGGYTALATKGVSSMLSTSFVAAFTTPVTYALIFVLLSTAVMQIRYVNKALSRFDSTQVIPIQFVMFTLCVIIGSAVLYRDFEKTNMKQAAKFVGGCLLTFFGVFLITSGRERRDDDDDEDTLSEADGVEETIGLTQHDGSASSSAIPQPQQNRRRLSIPATPSRRSSRMSRVSFAETMKPGSAHNGIESSATHYFEPTHSPAHLEGDEAHVLVSNPWQGLYVSPDPPRGTRTVSAESVLTRSALATTPIQPHPISSLRDGQGISSHSHSNSVERPVTPRAPHSSKSGHRARPFISPSPFSSTVTTAVKDVILRENDSPEATASSLRRIRSSIRASLFFNSDDEDVFMPERIAELPIVPVSEGNLPEALGHDESGPSADAKVSRGRSRSLSDTIGEFFRPKKQRKQDLTAAPDEDSGTLLEGDDDQQQQSSRSP